MNPMISEYQGVRNIIINLCGSHYLGTISKDIMKKLGVGCFLYDIVSCYERTLSNKMVIRIPTYSKLLQKKL